MCALGDAGERDPVERHGHLTGFLRDAHATLARKLAWFGVRLTVQGHVARGRAIVERARQERTTCPVAMVYTLVAMHRHPLLWEKVWRPVLAWQLASFQQ